MLTHPQPQKPHKNIQIHKSSSPESRPKLIYLDAQSTTPIDPRVLDSMLPYQTSIFGNPHSRTHKFGWTAEKAVEESRKQIANLINADPSEIVFVSGATEANNLALRGLALYKTMELNNGGLNDEEPFTHPIENDNMPDNNHNMINDNTINNNETKNETNGIENNKIKPHFITLQTEHKAVLETLLALQSQNIITCTFLPVQKTGHVDISLLKDSIKENTVCISIMGLNNEIGTIQNLEKIGLLCKEKDIIFHTDCAQALGKIDIDVKKMNIGMMSLSGHKIYGPKGIGVLFMRKKPRVRILPIIYGGNQERVRSGTVPVSLCVGMGKAAEIAGEEMERERKRIYALSKRLEGYLHKNIEGLIRNGETQKRDKMHEDTDTNNKDTNNYKENNLNNDKENNLNNNREKDLNNNIENNLNSNKETEKKENNLNNDKDTEKKENNLNNDKETVKIENHLKNDNLVYPGCLNISFPYVEGEGLMMSLKDIALSSGSACTSASLEPSYVLRALGTDEDLAHSSIRFGIGRFTMKKEIDDVKKKVVSAVKKLREISPLFEMVKEGIDLGKINWSA